MTKSGDFFTVSDAFQPSNAGLCAGIDNLLSQCAEIRAGHRLLIVNEIGAVDLEVAEGIAQKARYAGAVVTVLWEDRVTSAEHISSHVLQIISQSDVVIFNHTMGIMLRFDDKPGAIIRVANQALTSSVMSSLFAQASHKMWIEIAATLTTLMAAGKKWKIICPLGTDITGLIPESVKSPVGLNVFPVGIHPLIHSVKVNGRIAIKWMTLGSVRDFGTEGVRLEAPVFADVVDGEIVSTVGEVSQVSALRQLLARVGEQMRQSPFTVNAWHAGIHPQAECLIRDIDGLTRWMDLAHNNPRMVHFHAVGTRNGVASFPVIDPTISIDGTVFWDRGEPVFLRFPEIMAIFEKWQAPENAMDICRQLGIDE